MAKECCPTCGRAFAAKKAQPVPVNLAEMSTAELFAHYKKTAPIEDVRFALRAGVNLGPFRDDWQALLNIAPTLTRAETAKRLETLRAEWRRYRNQTDKRPAVGVGRPHARVERSAAYQVAQRAQREYLAPLRMRRINGHGWRESQYRARLNPERLVA